MSARPFVRTKVPDISSGKPSDTITRAEAVALVASRIPRQRGDDIGTLRNRVSSRLTYAVERQELIPVSPRKFRLGDVVRWARLKWPGRFDGLPITSRRQCVTIIDSGYATSESQATVLPSTLPECREQIRSMSIQIESLKRELQATQVEVTALAPKAERWDKWLMTKGRRRRS